MHSFVGCSSAVRSGRGSRGRGPRSLSFASGSKRRGRRCGLPWSIAGCVRSFCRSGRGETPPPTPPGFAMSSSRGLSDIFDPSLLEVETPGVRRIRDFLDSTPGGSIGLAGPRGTGKSHIDGLVRGRSESAIGQPPRPGHSGFGAGRVRAARLHPARLRDAVPIGDHARRPGRCRRRRPPGGGRRPSGGVGDSSRALSALFVVVGVGLLLFQDLGTDAGLAALERRRLGCLRTAGSGAVATERLFAGSDSRLAVGRAAARVKPGEGCRPQTALFADRCLELIRYQQTYTSGWSGSVKAGVGGLGVDGGVDRRRRPGPEHAQPAGHRLLFKEFVTAVDRKPDR